jgi:hypothetical protein
VVGFFQPLIDTIQSILEGLGLIQTQADETGVTAREALLAGGGVQIPGNAAGGHILGNRPYYVGEAGTELFVPDQSGLVVSNDQLTTALNALAMHGAGPGGRGDTYISIEIPADLLARAPQLAQNAEVFGQLLREQLQGIG